MSDLKQLFSRGCFILKNLPSFPLEVKALLLAAAGIDEKLFFLNPGWIPSEVSRIKYFNLISKRKRGLPLSYLTGAKEFWSIPFLVGEGVLIPRPETELVVEKVLENLPPGRVLIADVGTGCGNIAISLAKELPQSEIIAIDISKKALSWAKLNAGMHKVKNVSFNKGDLFLPLKHQKLENRLDCIISNPPYISSDEWLNLPPEIRNHEPPEALIGGKNGLRTIQRLIQEAPLYLKSGGILIFEIGWNQKKRVENLLAKYWDDVSFFLDFSRIYRVCFARRK